MLTEIQIKDAAIFYETKTAVLPAGIYRKGLNIPSALFYYFLL